MGGRVPNPGSAEAVEMGCICPVVDNRRGTQPPIPPGTPWGGKEGAWYIVLGCPVHHPVPEWSKR